MSLAFVTVPLRVAAKGAAVAGRAAARGAAKAARLTARGARTAGRATARGLRSARSSVRRVSRSSFRSARSKAGGRFRNFKQRRSRGSKDTGRKSGKQSQSEKRQKSEKDPNKRKKRQKDERDPNQRKKDRQQTQQSNASSSQQGGQGGGQGAAAAANPFPGFNGRGGGGGGGGGGYQNTPRYRYASGRQGLNYRYSGAGYLPGFYSGVLLSSIFYPRPYLTNYGQTAPVFYPNTPYQNAAPYGYVNSAGVPLASSSEPQQPGSETNEEEEEDTSETPQAPFSQEEMRSLAVHNAMPHRVVKSLEVVQGPQLRRFIEASNEFATEPDFDTQVQKGLELVHIAEEMDHRYGTHAMGWVKAVRNRPDEWSLVYAVRYADGLSPDQVTEISTMNDADVPTYLVNANIEVDETETEVPISCSIGDRFDHPSTSDLDNQVSIFYTNNRKILSFHLNGLIDGYSYVDSTTAEQARVPSGIRISKKGFTSTSEEETRLSHMKILSLARLLSSLMVLMKVNPITTLEVVEEPNHSHLYYFSVGIGDHASVYPLRKMKNTPTDEHILLNSTVESMFAELRKHQRVMTELFPGSSSSM